MPACRAAFIFSAMGFKEVRVLNTAFGTHYKKEEKEQKSAKQAGAASEIKLDDKFFATSAEVKKIVDGSSSDQLVDCRSETAFKKGAITKAKHLDYTKVWSNHTMKESADVLKAFKDAGIDIEKPMIFTGGLPASTVKAVADHVGFKSLKVYDKTLEEYKADIEAKAEADSKAAAAKTEPKSENPTK
jgi:3-mercaptopyruvate sulfurtransferase SseA